MARSLAALPPLALVLGLACAGPDADGPSLPAACLVGGEAPMTVEELVARIDALPHPVTLPCLIASLPRPLEIVATTSAFSVQPATGPENPRIFILGEGLVLSVIPAGDGSELLEISEWVSPTQTLKAEIPFPVDDPLDPGTPYDVGFGDGLSRCGLCHRNEFPAPGRPGAFVSQAMRPLPDSLVGLSVVEAARDGCDWSAPAPGCELLSALLDHGTVGDGAFSDELATFFD